MIIGINGKIGSGKDTIGDIIQKICITNDGPEFEVKKFAGKLKQIASLLTGIPVEKFEDQEFKKLDMNPEWGMTYREFLQRLGTEAMRDGLHENVWVNALFADYTHGFPSVVTGKYDETIPYPNWIITDMRFPNELEAVKEKGGITIRVVRPGTVIGNHPSETALDDAEFDYEIINDGEIEDLIEKVKEILIKEQIIEYSNDQ
jgi:hypothetical protein